MILDGSMTCGMIMSTGFSGFSSTLGKSKSTGGFMVSEILGNENNVTILTEQKIREALVANTRLAGEFYSDNKVSSSECLVIQSNKRPDGNRYYIPANRTLDTRNLSDMQEPGPSNSVTSPSKIPVIQSNISNSRLKVQTQLKQEESGRVLSPAREAALLVGTSKDLLSPRLYSEMKTVSVPNMVHTPTDSVPGKSKQYYQAYLKERALYELKIKHPQCNTEVRNPAIEVNQPPSEKTNSVSLEFPVSSANQTNIPTVLVSLHKDENYTKNLATVPYSIPQKVVVKPKGSSTSGQGSSEGVRFINSDPNPINSDNNVTVKRMHSTSQSSESPEFIQFPSSSKNYNRR